MLICGDARSLPLIDGCVDCIVTSPPYFGLRDYGTARWEGGDPACDHKKPGANKVFGNPEFNANRPSRVATDTVGWRDVCGLCGAVRVDAQIGLEPTPDAYVASLVQVFCELRRVLKDNGTVWLNLGDSYAAGPMTATEQAGIRSGSTLNSRRGHADNVCLSQRRAAVPEGLAPKNLLGIPWRVAFALQADGWYLRSDIIWHKPNPMPESVTDRPTKAHEYLFLLSKCERYYYDADVVAETATHAGKVVTLGEKSLSRGQATGMNVAASGNGNAASVTVKATRNKRSVWTVPTMPYSGWQPTFEPADYVGPDGKPYKASPDCLVHAPLAGRRSQQKAGGDAQLDRAALRSLDIDARRVARLIAAHAATVSKSSASPSVGSVRGQSLESTGDYRTHTEQSSVDGLTAADGSALHTSHTPGRSTLLLGSSDYSAQRSVPPATVHSTQSRRTARAAETTSPCRPSDETASDTADTSARRLWSEDDWHNAASSNAEADDLADSVSARTVPRTADIPSCKCTTLGTAHFATMPEALVEPCILAGCPLGGLVLDPFIGSGTVGAVAERLGRRWVGTDLSYQPLARKRTAQRGIRFDLEEVAEGC
jgi:DNA modification methylase